MIHETSLLNGITVTQDIIHLCNKGRNRLLKPNIIMPLGTHKISIDHLRQLLTKVHKSVHGLTYQDVFPVDRMNYSSFEKITRERVISTLQTNIPDSQGTVQYLIILRDIANSLSNYDLKPLHRLHLIWRSLYFLRIWRKELTFIQLER